MGQAIVRNTQYQVDLLFGISILSGRHSDYWKHVRVFPNLNKLLILNEFEYWACYTADCCTGCPGLGPGLDRFSESRFSERERVVIDFVESNLSYGHQFGEFVGIAFCIVFR